MNNEELHEREIGNEHEIERRDEVSVPVEETIEAVVPVQETPAEPVAVLPAKPVRHRLRNLFYHALVVTYTIAVLAFGYWYFARPVRSNQIKNAYDWWTAVGRIYEVPMPKDERWTG